MEPLLHRRGEGRDVCNVAASLFCVSQGGWLDVNTQALPLYLLVDEVCGVGHENA